MAPSVGEMLAAERRRKGKTLVDAAAATRIRAKLLEALENDRFDELPSPAYVKGYIQSYASFLEVPVEPLLEQYRSEQRLTAGDQPAEKPHPYLTEQVVPTKEQAHALPARSWWVIAAVLVLVPVAIWGISAMVRRPSSPPPVPPATESTTPTETTPVKPATSATTSVIPTETTDPVASDEPTTETSSSAEASKTATSSKPFTLKVRTTSAGGGSFLRIVVDGERKYEGTMSSGGSRSYEVEGNATIRIGDPRAVVVTRDGDRIDTPDDHEPFTLTLDVSGADQSVGNE